MNTQPAKLQSTPTPGRGELIRTLPAGRALLPEGDFRDWADIEAWASGIANALAPKADATTAGA